MNALTSIIIVNYGTARLLEGCVRSVGAQRIDAEVIIIDNNSGGDDREILESLRSTFPFVRVIFNSDNKGFSKANNQGLAIGRGDYILFLNPDTLLFPNCLEGLASFLKTTGGVGCVTPKLWMDRGKDFLLPPSSLPSPWEQARTRASMSNRLFLSAYRRLWLRKALSYWNARSPLSVDAVSGAFLMTTRQVLDRVGSFDERFPLYFEDSDLCMRMKKAGLAIYYYPQAEAVHYYNQSAKQSPESTQKFDASRKLYMGKYYSPFSLRFFSLFERRDAADTSSSAKSWDFSRPIDTHGGYLLFSPLCTMVPCAAHKATEEQFTFHKEFVDSLARGPYYVLILSPYGIIEKQLVMEKR